MSNSGKVKENKIQKWLENNYQNLTNMINGKEKLNSDENVLPYYSLDLLIKKKVIDSSNYVYKNLNEEIDLIIANQNISIDKKERIYPDLLLFNSETSTFIIVEIKRSDKSEREAITELLAYEHELKNLFPFISNFEVCFLIISSEFNTLLEHSIYSLALWQNKKILSLKINGIEIDNEENWNLNLHIPSSWSLLSINSLKPFNIETVNLVLYDKDAYNNKVNIREKENNFNILMRGLELIVKEAEKNNCSGFVLLSRMTASPLSNWCITIGVINHFSFYNQVDYKSKIKDYFNNNYAGHDFITKSVFSLANKSREYLKIFYDPTIEGITNWKNTKYELRYISNPITIDYFGQIDDIVNDFVINKQVRDYYLPELNDENINWKAPEIGLNLIDNILYDNVFIDGEFNYFNLYKFGTYIGTIYIYLDILKLNNDLFENENFLGRFNWIEIEFINLYREICLKYHESDKLKNNPVIYMKFNENREIDFFIEQLDLIIEKMFEEFINIDSLKKAFQFGLDTRNYFFDAKSFMHEDDIESIEKRIVGFAKSFLEYILTDDFKIEVENQGEEAIKTYQNLKNHLNVNTIEDLSKIENSILIESFEKEILPYVSLLEPILEYGLSKIDFSILNIDSLKSLYIEEYEKHKNVIVVIQQNGMININYDSTASMFKINPEEELLIMANKNFDFLQKVTWEDLKNNKVSLLFDDLDFAKVYNSVNSMI